MLGIPGQFETLQGGGLPPGERISDLREFLRSDYLAPSGFICFGGETFDAATIYSLERVNPILVSGSKLLMLMYVYIYII